MDASLRDIDAVFLDLDGTIYLGGNLIPGALDFLARCDANDVTRIFLTNNSSRSVTQYLAKLAKMGIPATEDEVLLSTHDLIAHLRKEGIDHIYLVGTEGMHEMMTKAGFTIDADDPACVVLGYDTEITYEKLTTASILLHRGLPLIVSHPDMVCPSPDGGLPDTGAYMALFEATTGTQPAHVCGKPQPGMILHRIESLGLDPSRCAMVGDRLYTDMAMATRSGVKGILVLSGEATRADVEALPTGAEQIPDLIVDSVDALLR